MWLPKDVMDEVFFGKLLPNLNCLDFWKSRQEGYKETSSGVAQAYVEIGM